MKKIVLSIIIVLVAAFLLIGCAPFLYFGFSNTSSLAQTALGCRGSGQDTSASQYEEILENLPDDISYKDLLENLPDDISYEDLLEKLPDGISADEIRRQLESLK